MKFLFLFLLGATIYEQNVLSAAGGPNRSKSQPSLFHNVRGNIVMEDNVINNGSTKSKPKSSPSSPSNRWTSSIIRNNNKVINGNGNGGFIEGGFNTATTNYYGGGNSIRSPVRKVSSKSNYSPLKEVRGPNRNFGSSKFDSDSDSDDSDESENDDSDYEEEEEVEDFTEMLKTMKTVPKKKGQCPRFNVNKIKLTRVLNEMAFVNDRKVFTAPKGSRVRFIDHLIIVNDEPACDLSTGKMYMKSL